ncbi:MAG TPA: hypothetical protein ENK11_10505 [Phycisphaerales bacterium]|nr:hypothetical protein [Phycisphaerales bacterium]
MNRAPDRRRAVVLFAVLFLVVLAGLSASTLLGAVAADRAAVTREIQQLRMYDAARSALLVWAGQLADQRDDLLDGKAPELTDEIIFDNGDDDLPAVVRLVPRPAGDSDAVVLPEAARLDLNHATTEMLAALPGVDSALAQRLVRHRDRGFYLSPAEALRVEGAGVLVSTQENGSTDRAPAAIDLLTVYAADARQQIGVADDALRGTPRVNVNAPWSDNLERALSRALDEAVAETASRLFIDSPKLETPGDLVRLLDRQGVERDQWPALLDALTTSPDPFRLGVVDINTAPRAVLATLPGLDDSSAAAMVTARERLDADAMRSITWPLDEGVIDVEAFASLVDVAVTRCLQWRVVLRVTLESPDDSADTGAALPEADEFGDVIEPDAPTDTGPFVEFEAVFDAAGPRVRLAYLRERTALEAAGAVRALPAFSDALENEPEPRPGSAGGGTLDDIDGPMPESGNDAAMTLDDLTNSFFDDIPNTPVEPIGAPTPNAEAGRATDFEPPASRPMGGVDNRVGRWKPARTGRGEGTP